MLMKISIFAGLVLALSGCSGLGAEGTLTFDGSGNGSHSQTPNCAAQGSIKGSGATTDGQVMVTVRDSSGKQLFSQSFSGQFTLASTALNGASGSWSFVAQRSASGLGTAPFAGHYEFYVDC
jgi:hypothetical protein